MTNDKYIVWLNGIFEPGTKKIDRLFSYFGHGEDIWNAAYRHIAAVPGISEKDADKIILSKSKADMDQYMYRLREKGISFITKFSSDYPQLLKNIANPPNILYYMGNFPSDSLTKVSIIGSRECTQYGRTMAYKISKELAEEEIVIVSGMARGIDAMAHKGCLDGGSSTVAVLGCGVDICYPEENRSLYSAIIEKGCIVSEYQPGTVAKPRYFPVRNRIISGLSSAVVVIEAGKRSGTSITANLALEYGREVMAVPGNATSRYSEGTNGLIKEGAALVTCGKDVLNELGIDEKERKKGSEARQNLLASDQKLVYDCISLNPVSVEEIAIKTDMKMKELQYILTILEINKYIQRLPGQKFIRAL